MKHTYHPKTKERNKIMRKVLIDICNGKELKLDSSLQKECIAECVERCYVTGIDVTRNDGNEPIVEISSNIFVTYDGIVFLENKHPEWQTTFNTVLGVISLLISLASFVVALLSKYFDISDVLKKIF